MQITINVDDEIFNKFKCLCDILGKDPIEFIGENATDYMANQMKLVSEVFDGLYD